MFGTVSDVGTKASQILNSIDRSGKYVASPSLFQPYIDHDGNDYINVLNGQTQQYEKVRVANGTALLQKDEWLQIDTAVQMALKQNLHFVSDLMGAGLSYSFDGMSAANYYFETANGLNAAERHMRPNQTTQSANFVYEGNTIPLPFTSLDYPLNIRQLRQSRKLGMGFDVMGVQEATYQVLKSIENLFVTATGYSSGGNVTYGIQNTSTSYAYTVDRNTNWDAYPTTTGSNIVQDVIAAVELLRANGWGGPFWVYVPVAEGVVLDSDYTTATTTFPQTIRQRILSINGVEKCDVLEALSAGKVHVISAQPGNIRALNGLAPTVFQWDEMAGLGTTLRVSAIMVPQIIPRLDNGYSNSGTPQKKWGICQIDAT